MKFEDLKIGDPIWILWLDSLGDPGGWLPTNKVDAKDLSQDMRHLSIGVFISETRDGVIIAGAMQCQRRYGGNVLTNDRQIIPKGVIVRWGRAKLLPAEERKPSLAEMFAEAEADSARSMAELKRAMLGFSGPAHQKLVDDLTKKG